MSVWFQLRAAICLLRNKLKWITRLMAFWLSAVQTGGSRHRFFFFFKCIYFLLRSLSTVDEDGMWQHARPLSRGGQSGQSDRWLLCTWLTRWNTSRAFSLGDDGRGWSWFHHCRLIEPGDTEGRGSKSFLDVCFIGTFRLPQSITRKLHLHVFVCFFSLSEADAQHFQTVEAKSESQVTL